MVKIVHFINEYIKNTLQNALFWKLTPQKVLVKNDIPPKNSRQNWHTLKNSWKSPSPPPHPLQNSKFQNFDPKKIALAYVASR